MKVIIADDHRIVREGIATLLGSEVGIELVGEADHPGALFRILLPLRTEQGTRGTPVEMPAVP